VAKFALLRVINAVRPLFVSRGWNRVMAFSNFDSSFALVE